ncbi:MAG TPA: hypothetical protein VLC71_09640 [Thermomonas sp.]|nr:hypothetical protein [Thermomonas sp.]
MTNPADVIGWSSSAILLVTLIRQIVKDQQDGKKEGASRWLFAGQTLASIGFVVYSIMAKNWVFIVTNSLILTTSVIGFVLQVHRKGRG